MQLSQVSLAKSIEEGRLVQAAALKEEERSMDYEDLQSRLHGLNGGSFPWDLPKYFSPYPICVPGSFEDQVMALQATLKKALTNVINRWFSDTTANFPMRMPIETHEEDLLRWIDGPGRSCVASYSSRQGLWRPDFVVERKAGEDPLIERAKICEINGRFPYNGLSLVAIHGRACEAVGLGSKAFEPLFKQETMWKSVIDSFDSSLPLYDIVEQWPRPDVGRIADYYVQQTGQRFVFVKPSELQLRPDPSAPTGQALFYIPADKGESGAEEIRQCSLELFQEELQSLSAPMLRTLATCCVNDMRTIFLAHDKRMLGILLEELDGLEASGILTAAEAQILKDGIVPTILPGSQSLRELMVESAQNPIMKDGFVLKASRGGMGNGHLVGRNLSQDEWQAHLRRLLNPLRPSEDTYAIQSFIEQVTYDIVRPVSKALERFHLVGMYYAIQGRYLGLGMWRLGDHRLGVKMNDSMKGTGMIPVRWKG